MVQALGFQIEKMGFSPRTASSPSVQTASQLPTAAKRIYKNQSRLNECIGLFSSVEERFRIAGNRERTACWEKRTYRIASPLDC